MVISAPDDVPCFRVQNGYTALMSATVDGDVDMVKKLLDIKATIDFENEVSGVSVLAAKLTTFV